MDVVDCACSSLEPGYPKRREGRLSWMRREYERPP